MTDPPLDVAGFLEERRDALLAAADEAVGRAHLRHYDEDGARTTSERLGVLLDLVIVSCREHRLETARSYADTLAAERHAGGFALAEVQTAINVLEEAVWRAIMSDLSPEGQAYALGLVSTVLGAVKDRVACDYIERIAQQPLPSLRLDLLAGGTEGGWVQS